MTRKLSGPIDGEMITREFFPDVEDPETINYGDCMKWAYIAYHLYEDVQLYSNKPHAFVKQGKKFYDSESPNGIARWRLIGCNDRCAPHYGKSQLLPHKQNLEEFKERWHWVNWSPLDKKIAAFWQRYDEKNGQKNLNVAA